MIRLNWRMWNSAGLSSLNVASFTAVDMGWVLAVLFEVSFFRLFLESTEESQFGSRAHFLLLPFSSEDLSFLFVYLYVRAALEARWVWGEIFL